MLRRLTLQPCWVSKRLKSVSDRRAKAPSVSPQHMGLALDSKSKAGAKNHIVPDLQVRARESCSGEKQAESVERLFELTAS